MCTSGSLLLMLCVVSADSATAAVELPSVIVTLVDHVEVPAREAGILQSIDVREGDYVKVGEIVGGLEDQDAVLAVEKAEIELDTARKEAENDVSVRYAVKSAEVAEAELRRARDAVERYEKSISQTELDELRLTAERTKLEIEQAELNLETARLTQSLKRSELGIAQETLRRRQITTPLDGMVVEVFRRGGEWVEPGEAVMRIVRFDRLRVEGFLDIEHLSQVAAGNGVTLSAELPDGSTQPFPGELVFISPEVDTVNEEVRILAEIENRQMLLRPGMRGSLVIHVDGSGALKHERR